MPKPTKSRVWYILKYLWRYTDDEHPAFLSLTSFSGRGGSSLQIGVGYIDNYITDMQL